MAGLVAGKADDPAAAGDAPDGYPGPSGMLTRIGTGAGKFRRPKAGGHTGQGAGRDRRERPRRWVARCAKCQGPCGGWMNCDSGIGQAHGLMSRTDVRGSPVGH